MKLLASTLMMLGAFASVEAACGGNNNAIPGDTGTTPDCICPSGFTGAACGTAASYDTCDGAALPSPDPKVTTLAVTVATGSFDTNGNDVGFTLQLPMTNTRKYTKVGFTSAGTAPTVSDACLAGGTNGFKTFAYGTVAGCKEAWQIVIPFGNMQLCGLALKATQTVDGYQVYVGNIHIEMEESVTLGNDDGAAQFGVPVTRTLVTDYPIEIRLDNREVAVMDATSASVYTGPQVDFAITGQNIKADDFNAIQAYIKYTTQYPYDITAWKAIEYPRVGSGKTAVEPEPITAAVGILSRCALGDYTVVTGTTDSKQCTKTNTLTFTTGHTTAAQCKFAEYQYKLPYDLRCTAGINDADCPLQTAITTNYATFTITSDNFCTSQSYTQDINGVITMGAFTGIKTDLTRQNAWKYGDTLLMRMQFSGLAVTDMALTSMEGRYDNSEQGADSGSGSAPWYAVGTAGSGAATSTAHLTSGTTDLAFTAAGTSPIQLGLVDGTEFRFTMLVGTALLGGASAPARGDDRFLRLRATVNVSYNNNARRRRRQAPAATGGGRQESETQTIQSTEAEAAPAPNSAVRAAPAVALVLALLSAVALL